MTPILLDLRTLFRSATGDNPITELDFDPGCVAELNLICETGSANILVLNTLPDPKTDDELRVIFLDQGVSGTIVGQVEGGCIQLCAARAERFLSTDNVLDDWVIICSDDVDWSQDVSDRLVRVGNDSGITRADAKEALDKLQSPVERSQTEQVQALYALIQALNEVNVWKPVS